MSRGKRARKKTSYCCVEGDRESSFVEFLVALYKPGENNIAFYPENSAGGIPDRIVKKALDNAHRDMSFAWFDEDFEPRESLSVDLRKRLAQCWLVDDAELEDFLSCPLKDMQGRFNPQKRKPILIVSNPVCCESIILQVLGRNAAVGKYQHDKRADQIRTLKHQLNQVFNGQEEKDFYLANLTKEGLEESRKKIELLDLLISMVSKS